MSIERRGRVLFVAVGLLLRGWTRRARAVRAATPAVDAAMSERIKREMETGI